MKIPHSQAVASYEMQRLGLQQSTTGVRPAALSSGGGVVWGAGVGVAATAGNTRHQAGALGDCQWVYGWVCWYPELLCTRTCLQEADQALGA